MGDRRLATVPLPDAAPASRREFDHIRRFAVNEPRGHDAIVGALLCEPHDKSCAAGVIYFNNVGTIGMCGHGTIGLAVTLAHMGRLKPGRHRFETPVGVVGVELIDGCTATVENVESYRFAEAVEVQVPGLGAVRGDVAWGGNWFFLTPNAPCDLVLANVGPLTQAATAIQDALIAQGVRGKDGALIDHVEFFAAPHSSGANSRNFVLCPGGAYDRSPCGTGTSAKLACLHAEGKLRPAKSGCRKASSAAVFAPASNRGRPAAFSRASADARSYVRKASWCRTPWTRSGTEFSVENRLNPFFALVILRLTAPPAPCHRRRARARASSPYRVY